MANLSIYSIALDQEVYEGHKELKAKVYNTDFCYWRTSGHFSPSENRTEEGFIAFYTFFKAKLKFYPRRRCKLRKVEGLELGSKLKQLILEYYGSQIGERYLANLEAFCSGKDTSKIEFTYNDSYYMKEYFAIYFDKNRSKLENSEVFREYGVEPDPKIFQREGIVFSSYGEVKIGTVINFILHGGKGRKYFYKDISKKNSARIDIDSLGRIQDNGSTFETIESSISGQIFNRELTPSFQSLIEGEDFFGDFIREKNGKIFYANGAVYSGLIKLDHRQGIGSINFPNGESYTGEWFGGMKHGQGVYSWPNGNTREGHWHADKMDNYGILSLGNGDVYQGVWRCGNLLEKSFQRINELT